MTPLFGGARDENRAVNGMIALNPSRARRTLLVVLALLAGLAGCDSGLRESRDGWKSQYLEREKQYERACLTDLAAQSVDYRAACVKVAGFTMNNGRDPWYCVPREFSIQHNGYAAACAGP